jgi:hypothetical protein
MARNAMVSVRNLAHGLVRDLISGSVWNGFSAEFS